jgi:hypothetical protein
MKGGTAVNCSLTLGSTAIRDRLAGIEARYEVAFSGKGER